jgi:SAM-dependent methyltransferase
MVAFPTGEALRGLGHRLARLASGDSFHDEAHHFWDHGAADEGENRYWAAQPLVRRAINRRITGDPDRWPMDWFRRRFAPEPFGVGLSAGCGEGSLERDVLSKRICRTIEGIDFSEGALARARSLAEEAGLAGSARYRTANLDALALPAESYDVVFFHGSLHHTREVDAVLATAERALKPGGILFVDEYMGPSREEWSDALWRFARAAFEALPEDLKNRPELAIPLPMDDPSESVCSSRIRPAVAERFELLEDRPYGGNILWFVFPCLDMRALREDRTRALSRLIAFEDHLLENGWAESYFRMMIARKK